MVDVKSKHYTLQGYSGPRTTWANERNFVMNHAPGAELIAQHVDHQSSALPLCHGRAFRQIRDMASNTIHLFKFSILNVRSC